MPYCLEEFCDVVSENLAVVGVGDDTTHIQYTVKPHGNDTSDIHALSLSTAVEPAAAAATQQYPLWQQSSTIPWWSLI
jgi:hypothetical protein